MPDPHQFLFLFSCLHREFFQFANLHVEPHPSEIAVVVNYAVVGRLSLGDGEIDEVLSGRSRGGAANKAKSSPGRVMTTGKQLSKVIRICNLSARTDNRKLSDEIVRSFRILPAHSKAIRPELEQVIKVLKSRQQHGPSPRFGERGTALFSFSVGE